MRGVAHLGVVRLTAQAQPAPRRRQLGLLGPEEAAEDHTDWLSEHYPVPPPKPGGGSCWLVGLSEFLSE